LRQGVLSWEDYLPPLSEDLLHSVERYDARAPVMPLSAARVASR
jgi:hypothetical protein